jgi:histidinol-phosphate aminotransferase
VVVIIDEAYIDFGGKSAVELIKKYDNLLVVQTYSKSRSMAGMRIGYAIGNKELIQYLNAVKNSYNSYTMNLPSIVAGVASLEDNEYFEAMLDKIIGTRERIKTELSILGFEFTDSKANFIFATHKSVPAKEIFEALKKEEIYVRYFASKRIDNYLRISVGTDEEMDQLIKALKRILADK